MGILHEEFQKIKQVFERWHEHVDPEQAVRDAMVSFMGEAAKLVHDLEARVNQLVAPIASHTLQPATPAPVGTSEDSVSLNAEPSGAQAAAVQHDVEMASKAEDAKA